MTDRKTRFSHVRIIGKFTDAYLKCIPCSNIGIKSVIIALVSGGSLMSCTLRMTVAFLQLDHEDHLELGCE